MKIRVVPSSLDGREQQLTSYLINDTVSVDAGALAFGLSYAEQLRLRTLFITHTHLDHVASLPFLFTNLFDDLRQPLQLYATEQSFAALREHMFNRAIWVELDALQNSGKELLTYHPLHPGQGVMVEGLRITPLPVNHKIETLGLLVEDEHSAVFFTSDTGPLNETWDIVNAHPKLCAVFIDLSFPAALTELAHLTKHHSTTTLQAEMQKISPQAQVLGVHLKIPYRTTIQAEITALANPRLSVAEIAREYKF